MLSVAYALCCAALALAFPTTPKQIPLVVWHGLGDAYDSAAMNGFMDEVRAMHPGLFIHSVYIDKDNEQDKKAGWFGDLYEQLEIARVQLAAVPELSGGFDAIGFSQGGQFLRAYVEWYNAPRVHNLITFGSQHMGVSDLPGCKPNDVWCKLARNTARAGVYTTWAQHNIIQAQYFRDHKRLPTYLSQNIFLTSINNEVDDRRNATYAKHLTSLTNFVMIMFTAEKTVVPKESSWFGSYAPPDETGELTTIPMRLQPLYIEDRIGLRTLDESGRVKLLTCEGAHMVLSEECLAPILKKYVGGFWEERRPSLVVQAEMPAFVGE